MKDTDIFMILMIFIQLFIDILSLNNHLLPLALSHFLPSHLTLGAVWEPFWPGYNPKCLLAYLSLGPLNKRTSFPLGAIWAS